MPKNLKLRDPKEKEIQKAILDWLRWNKVFCWKTNNVGIKKPNGSYIPAGMKGVSDILGILKGGVFLAIEVKRKKGILSDYQRDFINKIIDNGGVAFEARSLKDVKDYLKDIFI